MIRWLLAVTVLVLIILFTAQKLHFHWEPETGQTAGQPAITMMDQRPSVQTKAGRRSPPSPDLIIPVVGVRADQLVDTFTQARDAGMRTHDAIDIVAPIGTPVVAATAGRIEKLFLSEHGGNTIYQRSVDGRWIYYYAHLDTYQPGLREGMVLEAGDQIGTVGTSGNADPAAPHLHLAVNAIATGEKWYQGRPINPYPLLSRSRR